MLLSGGLFAGGVASIAWERIPVWRRTDLSEFRPAFAHTLRRVDKLQPALLTVCLAATIGFVTVETGPARVLALLAAAALLLVLVGSVVWLVPIQRRLTVADDATSDELERLRVRWLAGHEMRAMAGIAALALVVLAATA